MGLGEESEGEPAAKLDRSPTTRGDLLAARNDGKLACPKEESGRSNDIDVIVDERVEVSFTACR